MNLKVGNLSLCVSLRWVTSPCVYPSGGCTPAQCVAYLLLSVWHTSCSVWYICSLLSVVHLFPAQCGTSFSCPVWYLLLPPSVYIPVLRSVYIPVLHSVGTVSSCPVWEQSPPAQCRVFPPAGLFPKSGLFRRVDYSRSGLFSKCENPGVYPGWEHPENNSCPKEKQRGKAQETRYRKHCCTRNAGICTPFFL